MSQKLSAALLTLVLAALLTAGCTDTGEYPEDLLVISLTPASGQTNVSQNAVIYLRFSEAVDHQTVIGTNQIIVVDQANAPIPVSFAFQGETIAVTPASPLGPNATYGVAVRPGVRDIYGKNIETPFAGTFSTGTSIGTIPNFPPFQVGPVIPPGPGGTPGTFSPTGTLNYSRARHTLTTLIDGRILAVGGENDLALGRVLRQAEIFDPSTLQWTLSQSLGNGINGMNFERYGHTATLIQDGRVLVAGGTNNSTVWDTAELYDPLTDVFVTVLARMTVSRCHHTANLLENGNVLLIAGYDNTPGQVWMEDTMEVYDVNSGTFNATAQGILPFVVVNGPLPSQQSQTPGGRMYHISEVLADQTILIAGGYTWPWALQARSTDDAQIYAPDYTGMGIQGTMVRTGTPMTVPRVDHTANSFRSGETAGLVLIFGGFENTPFTGVLQSVDVFDYQQTITTGGSVSNGVFTPMAQQLSITRWGHTSSIVNGGMNAGGVLVCGGAQHMPPQDWNLGITPPPVTRTYPSLDNPGCIGCQCTTNSDILMPFAFGKNLNEPYRGINVTGQIQPTQDINGNPTDLRTIFPAGVFFHAAEPIPNGSVLICGGAYCPGCIPAPFQWLAYTNNVVNGISYQGPSAIYNP